LANPIAVVPELNLKIRADSPRFLIGLIEIAPTLGDHLGRLGAAGADGPIERREQ